MAELGLLSWFVALLLNPITTKYIDYITVTQIEYAYVLLFLYYILDKYGKKVCKNMFIVFGGYYTWIACTDSLIKDLPVWVCNLESITFFLIALITLTKSKNSC